MADKAVLDRLVGKEVKSIGHHEQIGAVKIQFTDGAELQLFAQEKAFQQVMVMEPKNETE